MTLEEYYNEYIDDVHLNAQIEGTTPDDYFFNDFLDKLSSMGELIDPQIRYIQKKCRNNKIMSFDAYSFDESDKSVVLISNIFSDANGNIKGNDRLKSFVSKQNSFWRYEILNHIYF